jgi:hypothetical protein
LRVLMKRDPMKNWYRDFECKIDLYLSLDFDMC